MTSITDFGLKENPFNTLPGARVRHWAGMPEVRRTLADVVSSVRPDDIGAREFILVYGDWGAGKTHALRFFADQINHPESGNPDSHAIYMREIMLGKSLSFEALYRGIVAQLGDDAMRRVTTSVKNAVLKCAAALGDNSGGHHDSVSKVIEEKVPQDDRKLVRAIHEDKGGGKTIPVSVSSDFEAVKTLASVFRVMTTPIGGHAAAFQSVYLFLDEMEYAFHAKAAEQAQFYNALRNIVNEVTERFALILSVAAPKSVVEAVLTDALARRLTRPLIECGDLDADSAKQFVKEYLEYQRPEGYTPPQPFYPFSEAAVEVVFEREPTLVPNNILRHLRGILERSIRREGLQASQEISRDMAEKIMADIGF